MLSHFTEILQDYIARRRPFAVATVIRVLGSASAKPGLPGTQRSVAPRSWSVEDGRGE